MKCPSELVQALGELAERYLDQEPHPVCCVCQWHAAVAARVFLPDGQVDGVTRGCVLPLCAPCLCAPDLPARIEQTLGKARVQGRGVLN